MSYVICHMSTSQWSPWIKYSTFCYWVCRKQKLSVNIAISLSQQNHWLCSDSLFLRGETSGQSWWFPGKLQPTCFLNHLDFIVSIWSIIEGIRNSFFFFFPSNILLNFLSSFDVKYPYKVGKPNAKAYASQKEI